MKSHFSKMMEEKFLKDCALFTCLSVSYPLLESFEVKGCKVLCKQKEEFFLSVKSNTLLRSMSMPEALRKGIRKDLSGIESNA